MRSFPLHDRDSAPSAAGPQFGNAEKTFGFVPNLIGIMASSPALAEAYLALTGIFAKTSLSDTEKHVVLLAASHTNECHYCMAAHSASADMSGVPTEITEALRNGQPIPDERLEALRRYTVKLVQKRGWLDQDDLDDVLTAGYSRGQALDVLVGVGLKTLSNYTNHIAETPLDEALSHRAWSGAE